MSDVFGQIAHRLGELERRLALVATVTRVTKNNGDGTLDLDDDLGFAPTRVPQASISAGNWQVDAPADEGTQGLLIAPGGVTEQGLFVPILARKDYVSVDSATARLVGPNDESLTLSPEGVTLTTPEGVSITSKRCAVTGEETIDLSAPTVTIAASDALAIEAGAITIKGPVTQTGGDITSDGISVHAHTHAENSRHHYGDGTNMGAPQ